MRRSARLRLRAVSGRKLDVDRAYPLDFVNALTEAGYLATLIPEEYCGAGLALSAAAAAGAALPRLCS
ncbi:acyl-CoA dehydrogenase [Mesorhizobium sp. B4-1-1]|nr:acyl-CoA dehydrogenase [Mesorhizobium sp. B4-1-1]